MRHRSPLYCLKPNDRLLMRHPHLQLIAGSSHVRHSTRHTVATGKIVLQVTLRSIWVGIEMVRSNKVWAKTSLKSAPEIQSTHLWLAVRAIAAIWVSESESQTPEVQVRWAPESTCTVRLSVVTPSRAHLVWNHRRLLHRLQWRPTNQIGKVRERNNKASSPPNSKACLDWRNNIQVKSPRRKEMKIMEVMRPRSTLSTSTVGWTLSRLWRRTGCTNTSLHSWLSNRRKQ